MTTLNTEETQVTDAYKKAEDRINTTRQARFEASRRLMVHHRTSQWMIAILSAALIAIPQIVFPDSSGLQKSNSVLQTLIATFVLIYSIVVSSENFYHRSKQMEACSLELSNLLRKSRDRQLVKSAVEQEYQSILDRYDNHEYIDYRFSLHNDTTYKCWLERWLHESWLRIIFLAGFTYYIPLIILVYLFISRYALPFINTR